MKLTKITALFALVLLFAGNLFAQNYTVEIKGLASLDSAKSIAARTGGVVVADTTKKVKPVDSVSYYVAVPVPSNSFADSMSKAIHDSYIIVSKKGAYESANIRKSITELGADTTKRKGVAELSELMFLKQNEEERRVESKKSITKPAQVVEIPILSYKKDSLGRVHITNAIVAKKQWVVGFKSSTTPSAHLFSESYVFDGTSIFVKSQIYDSFGAADSAARNVVGGLVISVFNKSTSIISGQNTGYRVRVCTNKNQPSRLAPGLENVEFGSLFYSFSHPYETRSAADIALNYYQQVFPDAQVTVMNIGEEY